VFIDFDGTITKKDVGASIFLEFGDEERAYEIINGFRDGIYNATQTWIELLKTLVDPDEEKIKEYASGFEIDGHFHEFISFLEENKLSFM